MTHIFPHTVEIPETGQRIRASLATLRNVPFFITHGVDPASVAVRKELQEHNDCTVRALHCASAVSYSACHRLLTAAGRRHRKGFHFREWAFHGRDVGPVITAGEIVILRLALVFGFPGDGKIRLATAIAKYGKGNFIFRKARHVFAVRDGVVFDSHLSAPGSLITHVWQVVRKVIEPRVQPPSSFVPVTIERPASGEVNFHSAPVAAPTQPVEVSIL